MPEPEPLSTVLAAFETEAEHAVLKYWEVACGNPITSLLGTTELSLALRACPDVRLVLCSPGRMERAACRASRDAAEAGRLIPVLTVDLRAALVGPADGLRRTVTEALGWTLPAPPLASETRLPRGPHEPTALQCGPIRLDPASDRVWVDGKRNDAIRGDLYVLLKVLLASPLSSVTWKEVDRTLQKARSPAAHRKMAQRLRVALAERRELVQTFAGGLCLGLPQGVPDQQRGE